MIANEKLKIENKAPVQFNTGEIQDQLTGKKNPTLWLGRYTADDIRHLLEKFDILSALKAKGFAQIAIAIEPLDRFMQALKIFSGIQTVENLLAEFRLREVSFSHPHLAIDSPLRMLKLEWLMLQNPQVDFSAERPHLPGQRHPGLGLAKRVLRMLVHLAEANRLAGVVNFPEFFHNAYFYLEYFYYCNPQLKGVVLALRRDLHELSLAQLSWAIYRGCVIDANTSEPYEWQADALIMPLDEQIKKQFHSAEYEKIVYATMAAASFVLNQKKFEQLVQAS
jgi:hypothetical protein